MAGIKDVINTLDDASEVFDKVVAKSQMKIYDEAITLMKSLELDGQGKVKQTIANLKLLVSIKSKLAAVSNNKEYLAGVGKFLQYFDELQKQQNAYFSANFPQATLGEQAKKRHEAMKQIAVQNVIEALTGDGLKANVTDKVNDILLRAVTTGAKFSNLQEELRAHLIGVDGGTGALSRYATTYATTAISQFTGQNNKLLTQDLGVKWFMYTGSTKETTREFCEHLVKKRYIHHSEIHKILQGDIDGHQCAIYAKTGLPFGMIEGTNEDNFQVNCGGWNCRHQLVPVSELAVPQELRDKFPDEEPVKTKPEPIPESAYKADLDVFTEYLSKHKSGLVANNVEAMKVAAEAGDQMKLDALIAEAKAVIKKNEASLKQKAMKAELKKHKDSITYLMQQYGASGIVDIQKAESLIANGSIDAMDEFVAQVEADVAQVIDCTNVENPMDIVGSIGIEGLKKLNEEIGAFKSVMDSSDFVEKSKVISKYLTGDKSTPEGQYMFDLACEANTQLASETIVVETKAKVDDVKAYSVGHPKSGKIANLVKEAEYAISIGDYDLANQKANEAQVVIDKNENDKKYKKAKKEAQKAAIEAAKDAGISMPDEVAEQFTPEQIQAAHDAVQKKLYWLKQFSLEKQKDKLVYEIDWLSKNQKYPTWQISQNEYVKELAIVENKISAQKIASSFQNDLYSYPYEFSSQKDIKALIDKIKLGINSGADVKSIESDINLLKAKKVEYDAEQEEKKKKEIEEAKKALEDAHTEYEDDDYTQDRKDAAVWHKDSISARDYFFPNAVETWKKASAEEKRACIQYTVGSGYITKFLRGIDMWCEDGGLTYAEAAKRDSDLMTAYIQRSRTEHDVWVKRDELAAFSTYKFGVDVAKICDDARKKYELEREIPITEKWIAGAKSAAEKKRYEKDLADLKKRITQISSSTNDLLGKEGVDESFMSCGVTKDHWFSGTGGDNRYGLPRVCLNIYCPKGTMMTYADAFNYYTTGCKSTPSSPWNGKKKNDPGECELFMQRGTKMRVTKAEYDYGRDLIFIDVDVIGQNCRPFKIEYMDYSAPNPRTYARGGYYAKYL